MREQLKKKWPVLTYVILCAVIVGAVLFLQPGWGFMDDFSNRRLAGSFWESHDKWEFLKTVFHNDISFGRFRPLYYSWVIVFYGLFQNHPLMFNLFLTIAGLLCLPVWGKCVQLAYHDDDSRILWIYCLSFFLFTPFWNIFMYLSVQERFYLLFGGWGFLCYLSAKKKNSIAGAIFSSLFFISLVLSKETGVAILGAVCLFSLLDILFLSKEKRVNGPFLLVSLLFIVPYLYFIKTTVMGGHYSKKYSIESSLDMFNNVPLICKGILFFAILSIGFFIFERFVFKRNLVKSNLWLLFPFCLIAYVGILVPWGYPTYMLSTVSLFLFSSLYLFVFFLSPKKRNVFYASQIGLGLFVLVFSVVPSIGVMADKRKVTEYVKNHFGANDSGLFFPPPYIESAESLAGFSGADIVYISSGMVDSQLIFKKQNYLFMHLDCGAVELNGFKTGAEIYANKTWSIKEITPDPDQINIVRPEFEVNFLSAVKKKIRSL